MTFFQKLINGFKREIKPVIYLQYDEDKGTLNGATVHHLDDIFDLDLRQVQEAIVFYIEEHLQGQSKK